MANAKYNLCEKYFSTIGRVRVVTADGIDELYSAGDISKALGHTRSIDIIGSLVDPEYVVIVKFDEIKRKPNEKINFNIRSERFLTKAGVFQVFLSNKNRTKGLQFKKYVLEQLLPKLIETLKKSKSSTKDAK